jgi:hypothetical protein
LNVLNVWRPQKYHLVVKSIVSFVFFPSVFVIFMAEYLHVPQKPVSCISSEKRGKKWVWNCVTFKRTIPVIFKQCINMTGMYLTIKINVVLRSYDWFLVNSYMLRLLFFWVYLFYWLMLFFFFLQVKEHLLRAYWRKFRQLHLRISFSWVPVHQWIFLEQFENISRKCMYCIS